MTKILTNNPAKLYKAQDTVGVGTSGGGTLGYFSNAVEAAYCYALHKQEQELVSKVFSEIVQSQELQIALTV